MRLRGAFGLALFFSIFGAACSRCGDKKDAAPSNDAAVEIVPVETDAGPRPRTTSAALALHNFNADVDQRLAKVDSATPPEKLHLVELLLDRAHYLGRASDLALADKLSAETADAGVLRGGEGHLLRGMTEGALHRFDDALHELDLAAAEGAPPLKVSGSRASIFMALGRYDEALALQQPNVEQRDALAIASAAILAAKMQKPAESARLFDLARKRFRDPSPFALAWIDFQRATVLQQEGEDAQAMTWFAEAVDVLPPYAHAEAHLAPNEPAATAIAKLEEIRKTSDDPEVLVALAAAQRRAGHADDAKALIDAAKKRYDELTAKYPEAFSDHAARFWLADGKDPAKALTLARLNAKNRPTEEALDLWMAAGAGAKSNDDLCASANAMAKLKYLSARGKTESNAALGRCHP